MASCELHRAAKTAATAIRIAAAAIPAKSGGMTHGGKRLVFRHALNLILPLQEILAWMKRI